ARQAVDRFLRRESSPAEFLDALHQARNAGYALPGGDPLAQLAHLLQQRQPAPADLAALLDREAGESERRNFRRVIVEAARRLAPGDALPLLQRLARQPEARADEGLRVALGRQLFAVA